MAKLTAKQRKALPASDYVFPKDRRYPIPDRAHAVDALARSSGKPEEAKVRAAVKRKFPAIKIKKALALVPRVPGNVEMQVPFWKDDAKQIVYGVVLTPGLEDSQGDVVTAEDIEKAAHAYLVTSRKHDVQHDEHQAAVETVESYVAPEDMTVAGQRVIKGSWVIGTHVSDPDTWRRVRKGELTGFSIGGTGERIAA